MGRLSLFLFAIFSLGVLTPNPLQISRNPNKEFVWVKGGTIKIGNASSLDSQPFFKVKVKGFWMQKHEVTNAQFRAFVEATGYQTLAERNGGSYVFLPKAEKDTNAILNESWWHFVEGANWKHPQGKTSTIKGKGNFPVVHIAFKDAQAYCKWAKLSLPTEIEREYAARKNGLVKHKNIWQGNFPDTNYITDGYQSLAPVGSYSKGKLGLFDMQGNVWEWCADPYHQNAYFYAQTKEINSSKPLVSRYFDIASPTVETRVIRGGSFLCADNYCCGYQLGRRMRASTEMTFEHIGFRCVKRK